MMEAWEWRHNLDIEQTAIWVATILNGAGQLKHPVKPEQLLGRPFRAMTEAAERKRARSRKESP